MEPDESGTYTDRLTRVILYIHDHLDEDIDLLSLADVACFSPFHWHRIYHAMTGETIAATVKRLRLHRAAGYLAQSAMPVAEVARRSGYPNLQSFTRTFGQTYGMPPGRYRNEGAHTQFQQMDMQGDDVMYPITIREMAPAKAVTVAHKGAYMEIGKAFGTLFAELPAQRLMRPGLKMVAIYYDDPALVPEADLRSRAGVISDAAALRAPLETAEICGGPYAVLRYTGPYAGLGAAYKWLYGTWLPASGREAADAPAFEEYINSPRDTPPAELLTDICLPLKA